MMTMMQQQKKIGKKTTKNRPVLKDPGHSELVYE
jgi:hypothetical protein